MSSFVGWLVGGPILFLAFLLVGVGVERLEGALVGKGVGNLEDVGEKEALVEGLLEGS